MRKIKCLALLSTIGILFGLAAWSMPAYAHVGDDPHVPNPRYNNFNHLNLDTDTYTTNQNFQDAIQNVDANFDGIDLHFRSCTGNPGKCVHVLKNVNCDPSGGGPDQCGHISLRIHNSGPDDLVFEYPPGNSVSQKDACRGIEFLLGMHLHHGDGCMNQGAGTQTVTICCGEGFQLSQGYCSGCRPLPPGNFEDYIETIDNTGD